MLSTNRTNPLSRFAAVGTIVLLWAVQFYYNFHFYFPGGNLFSWDTFGYYQYLPFGILHNDWGFQNQEFIDHIFKTYEPANSYYQAFTIDNGMRMPGYTIGMAVLYLPFFLLGHAWALVAGYPADGFSFPYQFCVGNGILVYMVIGILSLRKVLLTYFDDRVAALTILLICWGTNFYQEVSHDSLNTHVALFAGYCILMRLLIDWYKQPAIRTSLLLALTGGLMAEIRGSEVLLVFPVMLWGIAGFQDLKERFRFYTRQWKAVLLVFVAAIVAFLPQLLHWKLISGHWYFNNYQTGEGFNFSRPHLFEIFFSFKKSLLVYSPLLLVPFIGFFFMRKRMPGHFAGIFLFFLLNTYLLSCWLLWWNATSFGMRYFVQSYALLTLPAAVLTERILKGGAALKWVVGSLSLFLIFLNIFQTWQTHVKVLNPEHNTAAYYRAVFLRTSIPEGAVALLERDRNTAIDGKNFDETKYNKRLFCALHFDGKDTITGDPANLDTTRYYSAPASFRLSESAAFTPAVKAPFNVITRKEFAWMRIRVMYLCDTTITTTKVKIVAHALLDGTGRPIDKYEAFALDMHAAAHGQWAEGVYEYQTPYPFWDEEPIQTYLWLDGKSPVNIDDFSVEIFEPKD